MTDRSRSIAPLPPARSLQSNRWGAPRCGFYANAVMLALGARFLPLAYVVVRFVAISFWLFVPRARRASARYLDRIAAAGGLRRPWALRRAWDSYRHFVEYGVLLLDRALILARTRHGFAIDCVGLEHLSRAAQNPRGVILLSSHFGMAEISAPYLRRMGLRRPMNLVMYQDPQDGTEQFHARFRPMLQDVTVISTTDPLAAGVRIIAALRRGEIVAMRADRTLDGKGINTALLGGPLQVPAGPFTAAALSGAPVLCLDTVRVGHRHYRCLISPARFYGDDTHGTREQRIARAAADFSAHLDGMLLRYPLQWTNFYDVWQAQPPVLQDQRVPVTVAARS